MLNNITPLPPTHAHIVKTQVSEKDPHHQQEQRRKKEQDEEEIHDEVEISTSENQPTADKNHPHPPSPLEHHDLDIEV